MKELRDIIEAALTKGRKTIIETNDDEIDDWDPEEGIFHRIDEAKPVGPMKPMKPGETKDDVRKAADPNHEEETETEADQVRKAAELDAQDEEDRAPKDNKAVDDATKLVRDKAKEVVDQVKK